MGSMLTVQTSGAIIQKTYRADPKSLESSGAGCVCKASHSLLIPHGMEHGRPVCTETLTDLLLYLQILA